MKLKVRESLLAGLLAASTLLAAGAASPTGLLFHMSGDRSATADIASGAAEPNFQSGVNHIAGGHQGGALRWADEGYISWLAPGNLYAQRLASNEVYGSYDTTFTDRPNTPAQAVAMVFERATTAQSRRAV